MRTPLRTMIIKPSTAVLETVFMFVDGYAAYLSMMGVVVRFYIIYPSLMIPYSLSHSLSLSLLSTLNPPKHEYSLCKTTSQPAPIITAKPLQTIAKPL